MNEKTTIAALVVLIVIVGGWFYLNKAPTVKEVNNVVVPTENTGINLVAGSIVGSIKSASLGEYLTDTKGMTLYVSGDDAKFQSSCTGDCLKMWPPFIYDHKDPAASTDALSKRINIIQRDDSLYQYTYGEKPVYYYTGDKNPGDTNGNSLNDGKWSIVLILK